jgi:hypothetical protein
MSGRGVGQGISWVVLALLAACGGQTDSGAEAETGGGRSRGGSAGFGAGARAGMGGQASSGGRKMSDFVDPGCPDVPPPPGIVECDPLGDTTDCPLGFSCYPYVEHPFGEGCEAQIFGARCRESGDGTQGEVCGSGTDGCAAMHLCVIGLQAGRRCAKMCTFDGRLECNEGMICGETDVEGYGVCS